MRVHLEGLPPAVQHGEETDFCSQMAGIGSNLQKCGGTGVKQQVVDDLFILQRQPREFVRDRKNHMHVFHREQFLAAFVEPLVAGTGLTLGTMPGTTGVEGDGFMPALATTIQMATERRRSAVLDGEEDAEM